MLLKMTLYPHVLSLSYTSVTWLKIVLRGTTLLNFNFTPLIFQLKQPKL